MKVTPARAASPGLVTNKYSNDDADAGDDGSHFTRSSHVLF